MSSLIIAEVREVPSLLGLTFLSFFNTGEDWS